ncbi:MAG: heparinase II/III-family protein, partial [Lachnospiraceae bacterium]|nr:heparinase II/III-family protein [Lachnospiraceae bacterium]
MSGKSSSGNKRIAGFSLLRIIGCIAIVVMHSVNAAEMLYRSTISATQIRNSMAVKAGPKGEWHCQPDNGTFELWYNGRNLFP